MQPLDNSKLKAILIKHAPEVDADEDGIFSLPWRSTETFYRHTEEYVPLERRAAYKRDLENTFPGRAGV
jgi:hypothetical protein